MRRAPESPPRRGNLVAVFAGLSTVLAFAVACPQQRDGVTASPFPSPPAMDLATVMARAALAFRESSTGRFVGTAHHHAAVVDAAGRIEVYAQPSPPERSRIGFQRGERALVLQTAALNGIPLPSRNAEIGSHQPGDVTIGSDGFIETIRNLDHGIQQSWQFSRAPDDDRVSVEVTAAGSEYVATTSAGLHFRLTSASAMFRYSHATWIGADGRSWPVRAEFRDARIVLDVPGDIVAQTRFPALLDPIVSPEFEIDRPIYSIVAGDLTRPRVAYGGSVHLVVWLEHGWWGTAAYGARVRSDGFVLDAQPIWISGAGPQPTNADVSFDGTDFLVVWSNGLGEIQGRRVKLDGSLVEAAPFTIEGATPEIVLGPRLAFDGANHLVLWSAKRGETWALYGARVTPTGVVLSPSTTLFPSQPQSFPEIAFGGGVFLATWIEAGCVRAGRINTSGVPLDSASIAVSCQNGVARPSVTFGADEFLVAWDDTRNSAPYEGDIFAARVSTAGAVLDEVGFNVAAGAGAQYQAIAAFDGTNFLITWLDGDVYATRVTPAGSVIDGPGIRISPAATFYEDEPAVAFGAGNYLVVWKDGLWISTTVRGIRLSTSGALLDAAAIPISVRANRQSVPSVSWDGANFFVVWEDGRDYGRIYGARFQVDGGVLDPVGLLLSPTGGAFGSPSVTFDGTQHVATWHGTSTFYWRGIYVARILPDGSLLDPGGVLIASVPYRNCLFPEIASDETGAVVVAWAESDYSASRVGVNPRVGVAFLDGGVSVGTAFYVPGPAEAPALASRADDFLLAWQSPSVEPGLLDINAMPLSCFGTGASAPVHVATTATSSAAPALASSSSGWILLWSVDRAIPSGIFGSLLLPDGTPREPVPFPVATTIASEAAPSVSFDGTQYLAAWDAIGTEGSWDIRGTWIDLDGGVLEPDGFAIAASPTDERAPHLRSGGGVVSVAYSHFDDRSFVRTDRVNFRLVEAATWAEGGSGTRLCVRPPTADAGAEDAGSDEEGGIDRGDDLDGGASLGDPDADAGHALAPARAVCGCSSGGAEWMSLLVFAPILAARRCTRLKRKQGRASGFGRLLRWCAFLSIAIVLIAASACDGDRRDGALHGSVTGAALIDGGSLADGGAAATLPDAPQDVRAEAGIASARVSWTVPMDGGSTPITSYTVTALPGGSFTSVSASTTEATITTLVNATEYVFEVRASNEAGLGPPSQPSNVVRTPGVPSIPRNVTASRQLGSATVTWSAPADDGGTPILGYFVRGEPDLGVLTVSPQSNSASYSDLRPDGAYTFVVVAFNAVGRSAPASDPPIHACKEFSLGTVPSSDDIELSSSITSADLDGDGCDDVVRAQGYGQNVRILRGSANGVLAEGALFPAWNTPVALVAGDFLQDGRPDVAVASMEDLAINVLPNLGGGALGFPITTRNVGGRPVGLAAGRFNSDAFVDLVVGLVGESFSILLGAGDGTFRRVNTYWSGGNAAAMVLGDFDGDSFLDIAFPALATTTGAVSVWFGNGTGEFVPVEEPVASSWGTAAAADFDGDAKVDLAWLGSGALEIRMGSTSRVFSSGATYSGGDDSQALAAGDVNGDAVADLVVAEFEPNSVSVFLGTGNGTFTPPHSYPGLQAVRGLELVDVDGDRDRDVVVLSEWGYSTRVLLNDGDGTFQSVQVEPARPGVDNVIARDFDADGVVDLAVASHADKSLSILIGRAAGSFRPGQVSSLPAEPRHLEGLDLDGDGHTDFVLSAPGASSLMLVRALGDGGWVPPALLASDAGHFHLAGGDLNGDNRPDIVTSDLDGTVTVFANAGDGGLVRTGSYGTGEYPNRPVLRDLDGDGDLDLIVANAGFVNRGAVVLLNDGAGAFSLPFVLPGDVSGYSPVLADFDRDGRIDLAVSNYGVAQIAIYRGERDGGFGVPAYIDSPANGSLMVSADVNVDGLADLVSLGIDDVDVYLGNGNGGFARSSYMQRSHPSSLAIADVDGDGRPDLILPNQKLGTVDIALNTCLYAWPR